MKHDEQVIIYSNIVDLLKRNQYGLSLQEIQNYLKNNNRFVDGKISERTLHRYFDNINERMRVKIKYDRFSKTYRISQKDNDIDTINQWILNAYAITSDLTKHKSLSKRILIDPIPSSRYLNHILLEMERNCRIGIVYGDYGANKYEEFIIEPYCVKTYHNRWYLLGKKKENILFSIYCLDRIKNVTVTNEYFEMDPCFDAKEYFAEYYGVRMDKDVSMERVVLRAHLNERFILDRQPIHHSQKKIGEGEDYADFQLRLRPTFDFVTYLESQGRFIEVMEPQWLREELLRVHREAMDRNKF